MSAEKIIEQIQKDAEKQMKGIKKERDQKIKEITKEAKSEAENLAEQKTAEGKRKSENIKKIKISQANQEKNRAILKTKEEIIDECFKQAREKLADLDENRYKKIVEKLLDNAQKRITGKYKLLASGDVDRQVAEDKNIEVAGDIKASGGFILKSEDEKITLDYTFESILKRERDKIRIKVGKLLFSK